MLSCVVSLAVDGNWRGALCVVCCMLCVVCCSLSDVRCALHVIGCLV